MVIFKIVVAVILFVIMAIALWGLFYIVTDSVGWSVICAVIAMHFIASAMLSFIEPDADKKAAQQHSCCCCCEQTTEQETEEIG